MIFISVNVISLDGDGKPLAIFLAAAEAVISPLVIEKAFKTSSSFNSFIEGCGFGGVGGVGTS